MSDYSGPGRYAIVPFHAQNTGVNVWENSKKEGTPVKLYQLDKNSENFQFLIVDAGGHYARPEQGDREYLILCVNSGLYLTHNGDDKQITTELRSPFNSAVRWKLAPAGNGAFYINHVSGKTQFNVRGSGKGAGTEIISYSLSEQPNAQFLLKAIMK